MTGIPIPDGLRLSPQEWRVFVVLQDWADKRSVERAIHEPNGRPRYTPPNVIVAKLKRKLAPFNLLVECNIGAYDRRPRMWRIVKADAERAAA